MARIRSVHPGYTTDESFMEMSMAAKAAWPAIWTECDDAGVFEWKPIVLKARIFPADNVDFADVLSEYERLGCVARRVIDGKAYGYIRNFGRWQRPKRPSYRYPLPEDMAVFTKHSRTCGGINDDEGGACGGVADDEDGDSPEHVGDVSGTCAGISPQMEDVGGRREEGEERKSARARALPEDWPENYRDEFWNTYPHKVGKPKALGKLDRIARQGRVRWLDLMAGLRRYIAQKPPDRPWCNPETWLNQERWADEPATENAQRSAGFGGSGHYDERGEWRDGRV